MRTDQLRQQILGCTLVFILDRPGTLQIAPGLQTAHLYLAL
jgi:hypothetical protein